MANNTQTMQPLRDFNEKILVENIVTDQTLAENTVIPLGRLRSSIIHDLLITLDKLVGGIRYAMTKSEQKFYIRRIDIMEFVRYLQLIPQEYQTTETHELATWIQYIMESRKEMIQEIEIAKIVSMVDQVYNYLQKLRIDLKDYVCVSLLYAGGIGNMITIQPKSKQTLCNVCLSTELLTLLNKLKVSRAKKIYRINHSIDKQSQTLVSNSTADTIMTQRRYMAPLQHMLGNSKRVENALINYDPSRLLVPVTDWSVTSVDDKLPGIIILTKPESLVPTADPTPKEKTDLMTTDIPSIVMLNMDKPERKLNLNISNLKRMFKELVMATPLSYNHRREIVKNVDDLYYYMRSQNTTLQAEQVEVVDKLSDYHETFNEEDIEFIFGKAVLEGLKSKSNDTAKIGFSPVRMDIFNDDDFKSTYHVELNQFNNAATNDITTDNLKDYKIITTQHNRAIFSILSMTFTKVLIIYNENDKVFCSCRIHPGVSKDIYAKYVGIKITDMKIVKLDIHVLVEDLNICDKIPFIQYFNKYNHELTDTEMTSTNAKLDQSISNSPIIKIDKLAELSKDQKVLDVIEVNMWMDHLLKPVRPFIHHIDTILRNTQVLEVLKYKAPKLHEVVKCAGANTFLNHTHIPKDESNDIYYWIYINTILIPDILRQNVLGTNENVSTADFGRKFSLFIDSIQQP